MQTDKKKDGNTFFPQIADDCSFTFAGRRNEASSAHGLPSCRPVALQFYTLLYIYLSISRNGKCRKGTNDCHCQKFQIISQIVMLG